MRWTFFCLANAYRPLDRMKGSVPAQMVLLESCLEFGDVLELSRKHVLWPLAKLDSLIICCFRLVTFSFVLWEIVPITVSLFNRPAEGHLTTSNGN